MQKKDPVPSKNLSWESIGIVQKKKNIVFYVVNLKKYIIVPIVTVNLTNFFLCVVIYFLRLKYSQEPLCCSCSPRGGETSRNITSLLCDCSCEHSELLTLLLSYKSNRCNLLRAPGAHTEGGSSSIKCAFSPPYSVSVHSSSAPPHCFCRFNVIHESNICFFLNKEKFVVLFF